VFFDLLVDIQVKSHIFHGLFARTEQNEESEQFNTAH
jgi:hypothetical protein